MKQVPNKSSNNGQQIDTCKCVCSVCVCVGAWENCIIRNQEQESANSPCTFPCHHHQLGTAENTQTLAVCHLICFKVPLKSSRPEWRFPRADCTLCSQRKYFCIFQKENPLIGGISEWLFVSFAVDIGLGYVNLC